jgi:hypothetical protein
MNEMLSFIILWLSIFFFIRSVCLPAGVPPPVKPEILPFIDIIQCHDISINVYTTPKEFCFSQNSTVNALTIKYLSYHRDYLIAQYIYHVRQQISQLEYSLHKDITGEVYDAICKK